MALSTSYAAPFSPAAFLKRAGIAFYDALIHISEANSRSREVARLSAMSDEELAEYGLKRQDIARHVFHDILWA